MRNAPIIPNSGNGLDLSSARSAMAVKDLAILSMMANTTGPQSRAALQRALGYEFQGDRDIYTALGYSKDLHFNDFMGRFKRGDIAKRIVSAPVTETWKDRPEVLEADSETEETVFEAAWEDLTDQRDLRVWSNLKKLDLISGIGQYGVMFLGLSDAQSNEDLAKPVESGANLELRYLTPLTQENSQIQTYVTNINDPRYGLPEYYNLRFFQPTQAGVKQGAGGSNTLRVHWTRVIHVAEAAIEDEVFGTPRLEAVFNKLMDLERTVGGTGEGFWRNAFPGMQFDIDPDFATGPNDLNDLRTEIENYTHRMERYLRTRGVNIKELVAQVADPTGPFEVIISVVSGTTGIPKRILIGSERGELASSQDQTNWNEVITERREDHVNTNILDNFIGRMIMVGILPEPGNGSWSYVWPDLHSPSEKDRSDTASKRTEALVKYADSVNAGQTVPLSFFLRSNKFMGLSEDEAIKIEDEIEEILKEEELKLEEENAQMELELAARDAEAAAQGVTPVDGVPEGTTINS